MMVLNTRTFSQNSANPRFCRGLIELYSKTDPSWLLRRICHGLYSLARGGSHAQTTPLGPEPMAGSNGSVLLTRFSRVGARSPFDHHFAVVGFRIVT